MNFLASGVVPSLASAAASSVKNAAASSSPTNASSSDPDVQPNESSCKPPELTTEERKDEIRKVYRKLIMDQKDHIISEFKKALDSYLKLNLTKVNKIELQKFIQDTLFSQMKEFFNKINKSYVQYTILRQIFIKHKYLIISAIKQSIINANSNVQNMDDYTTSILKGLKKELDELDIELYKQQILIGGGEETKEETKEKEKDESSSLDITIPHIHEIANWFPNRFPMDLDKQKVNSDIAYIVKESFQEIMNNDQMLAKTVDEFLTKHIFPMIQKQMELYIGTQNDRVDISILRAYLDLPASENIIYHSIQKIFTEIFKNKPISFAADDAALSIYEDILTRSVDDDDRRQTTSSGGKTRRRRIKRKSKTRQNKKSRVNRR